MPKRDAKQGQWAHSFTFLEVERIEAGKTRTKQGVRKNPLQGRKFEIKDKQGSLHFGQGVKQSLDFSERFASFLSEV